MLEVSIGKALRERSLSLAVAESCTGGLLGHMITNVPGSSDYFIGGVVAYSNEIKSGIIGVNPDTIERHGAVSKNTALEMAEGVRKALKADIGLSITGIAGPSGGRPGKPVGTVFIGVSYKKGNIKRVKKFFFQGKRIAIKKQSALEALKMLDLLINDIK